MGKPYGNLGVPFGGGQELPGLDSVPGNNSRKSPEMTLFQGDSGRFPRSARGCGRVVPGPWRALGSLGSVLQGLLGPGGPGPEGPGCYPTVTPDALWPGLVTGPAPPKMFERCHRCCPRGQHRRCQNRALSPGPCSQTLAWTGDRAAATAGGVRSSGVPGYPGYPGTVLPWYGTLPYPRYSTAGAGPPGPARLVDDNGLIMLLTHRSQRCDGKSSPLQRRVPPRR